MKKWMLGMALAVGAQALAYDGSTFTEVRDVVFDRAPAPVEDVARDEWDVYRAGKLPAYRVTAGSFVRRGIDLLRQAAVRTVTEREDYYPRLPKLLHPNGVCFTGKWEITEPSPYSGYFAQGARGLFVGRASVALSETTAGHKRGFGFAGKIFPTEDRAKRVETANFFTVDVLTGTTVARFVDTAMTNEPEIGFDLFNIPLGLRILKSLSKADENPGFRPLTPIARLSATGPVRSPKWMRVRAVGGTLRAAERDFRNELAIPARHPNGITLEIAVSDSTKDTHREAGWRTLGTIALEESSVSYGCDRRLHFAHPKLHE